MTPGTKKDVFGVKESKKATTVKFFLWRMTSNWSTGERMSKSAASDDLDMLKQTHVRTS